MRELPRLLPRLQAKSAIERKPTGRSRKKKASNRCGLRLYRVGGIGLECRPDSLEKLGPSKICTPNRTLKVDDGVVATAFVSEHWPILNKSDQERILQIVYDALAAANSRG